MVYKEKRRRFMGLYCVDVQNDQLDIVLFKMKITKKLGFEKAIDKEWIITNGLGGYASSTIIGTNTRKYHGLLVAPLDSPGKRHLFVS